MFTLRQYLLTLDDPHGLLRTLGDAEVCRDTAGRALYSVGNSAAVFRIRHQGRIRSLRCYFRPMRHLREIYGERFLPREIYLYTSPETGIWADVVIGDWIEGQTLHRAVTTAAQTGDRQTLKALAFAFDRLAATLIASPGAHGDLKPENIIVAPDATLHLIDLDASYLPAFAGEMSPELGTAAYQHPARTAANFDASLDDFPAALISTALHALALDPTLYTRQNPSEGLLFSPRTLHTDPAMNEVLALFEHQGLATCYRIARLLYAPTLHLFGLSELLLQAALEALPDHHTEAASPKISDQHADDMPTSQMELFAQNGLWGYRTSARIVIAPLYDCGFDFSEGLAAVRLGQTWHFIDTTGRAVICCAAYDAVKPFSNGRAQVIRQGQRLEINTQGQEFEN